jgi:hypothetical protein
MVCRYLTVVTSLAVVLGVLPLIAGCCLAPTQNPIAAATAGAKIFGSLQELQGAQTPEEMLDAVGNMADTVETMTTSEIASAVNLVTGQNWSLEDAQQVKNLAAQVDEEVLDALSEVNVDALRNDPTQLAAVIEDVGIVVTDHQIDLITEAYESLQNMDAGALSGLIPGL